MADGPSAHLSWSELACKDKAKTPYPVEWRTSRAIPLAVEFERLRSSLGQPIPIISAYRTVEYNRRVPGAAKNSQHVQGRALDLGPPEGMDVEELYDAANRVALTPGSRVKGLGRYAWGVHMDIREHPKLIRWSGTKPIQIAPEG